MIPEHPFAPLAARASFVETPAIAEWLGRLAEGLGMREPFLLVTGPGGTGKSALVAEAIARGEGRIAAASIAHPALAGTELLEEIARRLGGEPPADATRPRLVACVEQALDAIAARGHVALLVVDDAQAMPAESLEELRLLVNAAQRSRRPLEVLLVGSPALEARLGSPELAALAQRVAVRVRVEPLDPPETQRYVQHRVVAAGGDGVATFPRRACREIAALTGGVPRNINALAAEALRLARAQGNTTVTPEIVRAAATALWGAGAMTAQPVAEAAAEDAGPIAVASAPPPAASPTGAPPGRSEDAPTPVPVRAPGPAPASASAAPASASGAPASASPAPASANPVPVPRTDSPRVAPSSAQDPKEWVKRFVGDRGPVQLSSRAATESAWRAEPASASHERNPTRTPAAPPAVVRGAPPAAWDAGAAVDAPAAQAPPARSRRAGGVAPVRFLAPVLVTLVVVSGAVLLVHAALTARHGRSPAAGATAGATPGERAPATAGIRTAVRAPGIEVRTVTPAPAPPTPAPAAVASRPRGPDAPVGEDEPGPAHRYTLDVGGYLELGRALEVRDHLRRSVGLPAWVAGGGEHGGETHRVLLGIYRNAERATSASELLLSEGKVVEARVVPLPPRRARR